MDVLYIFFYRMRCLSVSNIRLLHLAASVIFLMKLFHTLLHSFHALFPDIQLIETITARIMC